MERVRGKKCTFSTLSSSLSLLIKHFMGRDAICRHPISESLCHKICLELWNRKTDLRNLPPGCRHAAFSTALYTDVTERHLLPANSRGDGDGADGVSLLRMRYMHFADFAQPAPHTYGAIWKCKIWMNPDIIFCPDSLNLDRP